MSLSSPQGPIRFGSILMFFLLKSPQTCPSPLNNGLSSSPSSPPPPPPPLHARPPIDERLVLEGILWKLNRNAPWYDMPPEYPSYQTCYRRYRMWQRTDVMRKILLALWDDLFKRGCSEFISALRADP